MLLIYLKTYINEEQNIAPMPEQSLTIAFFATLQDKALGMGSFPSEWVDTKGGEGLAE